MTNSLVMAIAAAHFLHSLLEIAGMRTKLTRLSNAVNGQKLKPSPVNIDTRPKALGIGFGMTAVLVGIFYLAFSAFSISTSTTLFMVVLSLVLIEVINTVNIDRYHVDIQKLINKFSK